MLHAATMANADDSGNYCLTRCFATKGKQNNSSSERLAVFQRRNVQRSHLIQDQQTGVRNKLTVCEAGLYYCQF